jgi:hypothetical protein
MQYSETTMVKRYHRLMDSYPRSFRGFCKRSDFRESSQIARSLRSKTSVNPAMTASTQVRRRLLGAGIVCQRVFTEYTEDASALQAIIEIGRRHEAV